VVARNLHAACDMTCEASHVIVGGVAHDRFMRVVAGDALEARISFAPAPASLEAIGLETHVAHAGGPGVQNVTPSAMACAAEIHGSDRTKRGGIEDCTPALINFSGLHRGNVLGARAMASLARNPGRGMIRIEATAGRGGSGVAAEAMRGLVHGHAAAESGFEIGGRAFGMTGGDVEALQGVVKTQPGIVDRAVALEEIGLALVVETEGPDQRLRDGTRPVRDGEIPFNTCSEDLVAVGA